MKGDFIAWVEFINNRQITTTFSPILENTTASSRVKGQGAESMYGEKNHSSHYYKTVYNIREKFISRLDSEVQAIGLDLEIASEKTGGVAMEALKRLHHRLHEITGSAGMLGMDDIHSVGRTALDLVEPAVDGGRPLDDGEGRAISSFLLKLSKHIQDSMAEK